jgi:hypothetical protein
MSSGGVFTLISNSNELDRLLMQFDYAKTKALKINASLNIADGKENSDISYVSSLIELERSHTLFIKSYYKPFVAVASEYAKATATTGGGTFGSSISFDIPKFGEFVSDMTLHVRISSLQATSSLDRVRWTSMLGHRLMKKNTFCVDNIGVSEYDSDIMNNYFDNKVKEDHKISWLRSIGQEIPVLGYLTPDPDVDEFREYRWIGMGNQTHKNIHPEIDLFIPLIHWFNKTENALPHIKLPRGSASIKIDIAPINELVAFIDNGGGGAYKIPPITACDLYVNNLFVMPEMYNLFLKNAGMSVIKVYKKHSAVLTKLSDKVSLHGLKFPIETLSVAFRPQSNLLNSQNWHKYCKLTQTTVPCAVVTGSPASVSITNATFQQETDVVSRVELLAHGISICRLMPASFYGNYTHILGQKGSSANGWYRMHFNARPDKSEPSGYLNFSNSREMYLNYETSSSTITLTSPVDIIVIAEAFNIFVMRDSTAYLKFST